MTISSNTFTLADDLTVTRMGYGAMQLAGPHVMGPPADRDTAVAVLREAVRLGITHIDTSDFYGPHVTNEIIREALHPYPADLHIVTKVGARRDAEGGWPSALAPEELRQAVHDNLKNLGLEALDVVNLRVGSTGGPAAGSIAESFGVLAQLQTEGLIKHLGLSNVTADQVTEAQAIGPVVCVQNLYNLAHRPDDDLIVALAGQGIAFVPFFPLGSSFTADNPVLGHPAIQREAAKRGRTPAQIVLAWTLSVAPNVLLIPGTSSVQHLEENMAAVDVELDDDTVHELNDALTPSRRE
jgi:pyridoxine 4-dehydrogenase